jgi:hypothetical protein
MWHVRVCTTADIRSIQWPSPYRDICDCGRALVRSSDAPSFTYRVEKVFVGFVGRFTFRDRTNAVCARCEATFGAQNDLNVGR